jgi:predicted nucleic acid-binding protein
VVVVDASALAAVIFTEPEGPIVLEWLREQPQLAAPVILPFELANTARTKIRRRPADARALRANLADGLERRIHFRPVDFSAVLDLALTSDLSTYDASYLWLARSLGVPLITLDKKLAAAAQKL